MGRLPLVCENSGMMVQMAVRKIIRRSAEDVSWKFSLPKPIFPCYRHEGHDRHPPVDQASTRSLARDYAIRKDGFRLSGSLPFRKPLPRSIDEQREGP
ncbi:MAG: hypothetical protein CMJ81_08240 [Planctomycetaceae bacterium]|nr:hypothetical protein [Planctomycetaceae bacterium]MBP61952.1 hypothetical protein [Planctomycetaceae bacterium]